jgi:K+-sensing histidine kinase KdpD
MTILDSTMGFPDGALESVGGQGPVVCAVDASPGARSAVRVAKRLATSLRADLMLVHAVPDYEDEPEPAATRRRRRGVELVMVNARRVTAENHVVHEAAGDDSKESRLQAYAHESGARVLVAGAGVGAVEAWLAAGRDRSATCPVIIVCAEHS